MSVDRVQLPAPAAHLSARVTVNWKRGYTAYQVEGVGTFTLIPALGCWRRSDHPGRKALPCNHVDVYMGTGGPHTRQENRTDVPRVQDSWLAGPITARTDGDPAPIVSGQGFIYWYRAPQQAYDILAAVAAHWGQRPDIDRVKAAYARSQAPRLERRADKFGRRAQRQRDEAQQKLARIIAFQQYQQRLIETTSPEEAAQVMAHWSAQQK